MANKITLLRACGVQPTTENYYTWNYSSPPGLLYLKYGRYYQSKDAMKLIPRGIEQIIPVKPEIYNLLNALLCPQELKISRICPAKQPT